MSRLYVLGAFALIVTGLVAWALLERSAASTNLERATTAEWAASDARAAAAANAASADWHRKLSAEAQAQAGAVSREDGRVASRVLYVVQEVNRAPDAYSPLRASLRLALDRMRELNATGPGAPRANSAAQAGGAAADPGTAGPARPVTPPGDGAFGAYCVALLGHVIRLENRLVAVGAYWDAAAASITSKATTE